MSLETVEILWCMEKQFHIKFPDLSVSKVRTVADLQSVIMDLLVAQGRMRDNALRQEVWDGMMAVLARQQYPVENIRPESTWVGDITKYG
jgi:hypothetical protein